MVCRSTYQLPLSGVLPLCTQSSTDECRVPHTQRRRCYRDALYWYATLYPKISLVQNFLVVLNFVNCQLPCAKDKSMKSTHRTVASSRQNHTDKRAVFSICYQNIKMIEVCYKGSCSTQEVNRSQQAKFDYVKFQQAVELLVEQRNNNSENSNENRQNYYDLIGIMVMKIYFSRKKEMGPETQT